MTQPMTRLIASRKAGKDLSNMIAETSQKSNNGSNKAET